MSEYNRFDKKNKSRNKHAVSKRSSYDSQAPIIGDDFQIITPPKSARKKKKNSVWRTLGRVIVSCFLIGVISACLIVGSFMIYVFAFVDGTVEQDLNNLKLAYTSVMIAQDSETGEEVELKRLHGEENRLWVDFQDIPEHVQYAYISAEDKRFKSHDGIDWRRTFMAFVNMFVNIYDSQQGGSTITQQLVKNLTEDDEKVAMRKVREIMRARYLEGEYSKDTILECYLNTIHLGNGVDGVEVASNYYFDKHVSEINLTQAACLAALTKSPSGYDPYNYPEDNKSRRDWILNEMKKNGYITEEECEAAKAADLELRKDPSTTLSTTNTVEEEYNSWFVDACIEDVIAGLMVEKGWSYKYAESQLYQGGFKIYTTIDLDIQKQMDKVFTDDSSFMTVYTKSGKKPQASMTILDYEGHIVAIAGGRGEKEGNRILNRATQSPRQTGSAIKPITAYSLALEKNVITYGSKMVDEPVTTLNGKRWPVNYTGTYSGTTTVLKALEVSMNTIPVKLIQELGIQTSFDFAKKMGLDDFVSAEENSKVNDENLSSLALGGSAYGATTCQVAGAYQAFGNLGLYYKPTTYTKVLDQKDEVVLEETEPEQVIAKDTSQVMNKMLQRVTTNGTGTAAAFGRWPIISKTGTTSDTKDRWFVGGTPYYVSAVWFGMDNNDSMSGLYSNPALRIWKLVMEPIHKGLKLKDFPDTDRCVYRKYCTVSGLAATSGCYSTAYGWFKSSYEPVCGVHYGTKLDAAEKPLPVDKIPKTTKAEETTKKTKKTKNKKTEATQNATVATTAPTASQTVPVTQPTQPPVTAPPTTQPPTEPPTQQTEPPTSVWDE